MSETKLIPIPQKRFLQLILAVLLLGILLAASYLIMGTRSAGAIPVLTATKGDFIRVDNDSDGMADPGDTIHYTAAITQSGTTNAHNVNFSDTIDFNTTLLPGSIWTTPIARNDSYATQSDVALIVPNASGLLSNDDDLDGRGAVVIFEIPSSTAQGGTISSVDTTNGGFTYNPPLGFQGIDSFSYLIQDADYFQDPAWVSILVTNPAAAADLDPQRVMQTNHPSLAQTVDRLLAALSSALAGFDQAAFAAQVSELAGQLTDDVFSAFAVTPAYASGETIVIGLGDLDPGQVVLIIFDVTVDNPFPTGVSNVCNQGLFTGANFADLLTDDTAVTGLTAPTCTTIDINPPNLTITKDDGGVAVTPGSTVVYTLNYQNLAGNAAGVLITDTVPANSNFNATASAPTVWSCADDSPAGTACTTSVGALGAGSSGTAIFAVDVENPLAAGVT